MTGLVIDVSLTGLLQFLFVSNKTCFIELIFFFFSGIFSPRKRHDPCPGFHAYVRVVQERDGPGWIPLSGVCLTGNLWMNQ